MTERPASGYLGRANWTPDRQGRPDEILLSARDCGGINAARVDNYSARAGTRLLPVGESHRGHLTLLIGEDGRWFAGYDDVFGLIGETSSTPWKTSS
jgi:hypothetical protein